MKSLSLCNSVGKCKLVSSVSEDSIWQIGKYYFLDFFAVNLHCHTSAKYNRNVPLALIFKYFIAYSPLTFHVVSAFYEVGCEFSRFPFSSYPDLTPHALSGTLSIVDSSPYASRDRFLSFGTMVLFSGIRLTSFGNCFSVQ